MTWKQYTDMLHKFLTAARAGLITDVDGTISPIVPHPDEAQVTPQSRHALAALRDRLAIVGVISGRAAVDIYERVGVPGLVYVGNHGLERWVDGHVEPIPTTAAYRPALEAAIQEIEALFVSGMWIEDKNATISVHYRQTNNPELIARTYPKEMQAIAERHGLRFFEGRRIFEFRPPIDVDKGAAFRRLINEHDLTAAMYIGDDITDVDAFRVAHGMRQSGDCYALAVGVRAEETPDPVLKNTDMLAEGVSDVEALLHWLVEESSSNASST